MKKMLLFVIAGLLLGLVGSRAEAGRIYWDAAAFQYPSTYNCTQGEYSSIDPSIPSGNLQTRAECDSAEGFITKADWPPDAPTNPSTVTFKIKFGQTGMTGGANYVCWTLQMMSRGDGESISTVLDTAYGKKGVSALVDSADLYDVVSSTITVPASFAADEHVTFIWARNLGPATADCANGDSEVGVARIIAVEIDY